MLTITRESTDLPAAAPDKRLDPPIDVALLLRAAVESLGYEHQVAAAAVGYAPDYWNRALGNERGVVLGRLGRLPADVQIELVTRWADALGVRIDRRATSPALTQLAALLDSPRVRLTIERL